ncbi:MAG: hypothetical protein KIS87_12355 [Phycisphaeraceae bacterium]|nr:hypothetical protein [Phycisphaeraceae bacterium]
MSQQLEVKFRPFSNPSAPWSAMTVGVEHSLADTDAHHEFDYTGTVLAVAGEHADPEWIGVQAVVRGNLFGQTAEHEPVAHAMAKELRSRLFGEHEYLEVYSK